MNVHKRIKRLMTLSLTVAAAAILWLALSADGEAPTALAQTGDTPTPVPAQDTSGLPPIEGKLNPPQYPNMDSNLNRIVQQAGTGQFTAQAAAAGAPVHSGASVAVTLYITESYADAIAAYLTANGASPRNIGADYIEAYVPVSLLASASQQEGVISIRTIIPPEPAQGVVVSEGVAAHGVPAWHAAGLKGQGVKIGIIDTGFQGFQSLMGTELPASVEVRCYPDMGVFTANLADCTDSKDSESRRLHGTAVTETIFDIAPEAIYYIANTRSEGDLQTTVDWMVEHDVDVINMSVSWTWEGPGDGTSPFTNGILRSVDTAIAGGITWVNSAGNAAEATWFGSFNDTNGDGLHEFSGTDNCNNYGVYQEGQLYSAEFTREVELTIQLRWDDRWGGANKDLDLILAKLNETTDQFERYAISEAEQSGGAAHLPFEFIAETVPAGVYCLAINLYNGTTPNWIQIQDFNGRLLQHHTSHHSITNPSESRNPGMLAVGAARWSDTSTIEPFSSQGPTPDGRIKPDIVGADGGRSVTYSMADNPDGNFYGTSQASPHVAGLAVLVKQNYPTYTPQQIANYLKTHAEERGEVGADNVWGYGFAKLPATDVVPPEPPPTTDSCVQPLTGSSTIDGSWDSDSDCASVEPANDGGNRYARFYTFTLTEATDVTITLESEEDTYLYLRQGTGRDDTPSLCQNDDYRLLIAGPCGLIESDLDSTSDSGISASLEAGDYTIEATTYEAETTGDFTLTVEIGGSTPAPPPPPPPGGITDAACNQDDLTHLGIFTLDSEFGPETYTNRYDGIAEYYWAVWGDAAIGLRITCSATQYDSVHNARWDGLNYSTVMQNMGTVADLDIFAHEQAFVSPYIGYDMLAFRVGYEIEGRLIKQSRLIFLDAATNTVTTVRFIVDGSGDYPDIDQVAGVARRIAARVLPADASQSAGTIPEAFGWIE